MRDIIARGERRPNAWEKSLRVPHLIGWLEDGGGLGGEVPNRGQVRSLPPDQTRGGGFVVVVVEGGGGGEGR